MALVRKSISTSKAKFLAWLCCSPCCLARGTVCGLISLLTCCKLSCTVENTAESLPPCCDSSIEDKALVLAHRSLSYSLMYSKEPAYDKLCALENKSWKAVELFSEIIPSDEGLKKLCTQINTSLYNIINEYDFGRTSYENLSEEDEKFVSESLRSTIFNQLPSSESFFAEVKRAGIDDSSKEALNGFILGVLTLKIDYAFLFSALNDITRQLQDKHAAKLAADTASRHTLFSSMDVGKHATFSPVTAPPPTQTMEVKR